MATVDRQHDALQTIFSFFLGLMVVAVIGVGVSTFYPSPASGFVADYSTIQPLMDAWERNTSIALVLFATLTMGISLVRSEQLKVLSNGLLLGGFFTMLYGSGMSVFSGTSYVRFVVVVFALAVAIGLGYARFVWLKPDEADAAGTTGSGVAPADATGLAARVAALEAKTDAAAAALGRREGD